MIGNRNIEFVIFDSSKPRDEEDLGFKIHYLGRLSDEIYLTLVHSAADAMIVPSIQEAFGQTASESLACGTPVAAFGDTGILDIVDHKKNGYLAKPFDTTDLAHSIKWVLDDNIRWRQLSRNAREKVVNEFDIVKVAKRYMDLYKDVIRN